MSIRWPGIAVPWRRVGLRRWRGVGPIKLRSHLVGLVVAALLPLLTFAVGMVFLFWQQQRAAAERANLETVRALSSAIDRKLSASLDTLEALAESETLDGSDLRGFYDQALRVLGTRRDTWLAVSLVRPSGRQLLHSERPLGAALPSVAEHEYFHELVKTNRLTVSGFVIGVTTQRPQIVLSVPVWREGKIKYFLSAALDVDALNAALGEQNLPQGWIAVILDRQQTVVARSPDPARFAGRPAPPDLTASVRRAPEGSFRGILDGTDVYTSFTRSPLSGWTLALGVPAAGLTAVFERSLVIVVGVGLALLGLGIVLAMILGRHVVEPIESLSAAAGALGRGERLAHTPSSGVEEVKHLSDAIQDAATLLQQRFLDRQRAEDALRVTLSSIGDAVIATDTRGRVTFMNPVAQALTGWSLDDATGKPVESVFRILTEESGRPVESPVRRVLREGQVVGLANHTVLVAKDGSARPIDDSGAPIRDDLGNTVGVVLVFHDVTERRRADRELRQALAYAEGIVDTVRQPLVVLDGQLRVRRANRTFYETFRTSPEATEGRLFHEVGDCLWDIPGLRRLLEDVVERDATFDAFEVDCRIEQIGRRTMLLSARRLYRDDDVTPLLLVAIEDISERKQLEAERLDLLVRERAARTDAEAANRMKDEFLATLSHELRTPLNAMLGWSRLLRTGSLDAATSTRALESIERNTSVQARLIEDLLDVSRILTGKLGLNTRPIELPPVIEAAMETVRTAAEAKSVRLTAVFDRAAGPVIGDADRLQQVFWNLLSNAVKFTPAGGEVRVWLSRSDSRAKFTVHDTGEGIAPEFLPHVFDRFRQADSGTMRSRGGLGLGLAIVRHLVELHGGTVHAESQGKGYGASFTVDLPLAAVRRVEALPVPDQERAASGLVNLWAPDSLPRLDGVQVLIVDDEPDARELLMSVLAQHGASVTTAGSAAEALAALDRARMDVLVSDIGMPDEDGYALIRKVRARGGRNGPRIPAIALTAYARVEDRARALLAGFQLHVTKPVEPTELVTAVASLAGRTGND
jgi:PAS domain S-box-containing protein